MELGIAQLIIVGLLEVLLMTYVGLGLLGVKTTIAKYLQVGVLYVLGAWIVRSLLQLFGLHTIILCILLIILIKFIIKVSFKIAIIAVLLSFVILFIGEIIILQLITSFLNMSLEQLFINDSLILFIPHVLTKIFLIISAVLIYFFDIKFIDLAGEENEKV